NQAAARQAEGEGEAAFVRLTGQAEADRAQAIGLAEARATEALGLARAAGFEAQRAAIGEVPTALVAAVNAIAEGGVDVMPEVLVTGGGGGFEGLAATLMNVFRPNGSNGHRAIPAEAIDEEVVEEDVEVDDEEVAADSEPD